MADMLKDLHVLTSDLLCSDLIVEPVGEGGRGKKGGREREGEGEREGGWGRREEGEQRTKLTNCSCYGNHIILLTHGRWFLTRSSL